MPPDEQRIRLDHFLKLAGIASTGGQAKMLIQGGEVQVNDVLETRRSRKLIASDTVTIGADSFLVSDSWRAES